MSALDRTGTVLGGKYRLGELLGRGGMGTVYEAVQTDLSRHVAVKILHAAKSHDATYLERFRLEAKTGASLGHPHIVQVTDFDVTCEDGDPPFLVMELLRGESLRKRLDSGRLPSRQAVAIALQTLSALDALHGARIVHRDIKPENLFLVDTATNDDFVKVLDFGVAKHPKEASGGMALTHEGHILGTLAYMAPEQARGDAVDVRADVYAVAACLYHMLTGRRPFVAATTAELWSAVMEGRYEPLREVASVDARLATIVERALGRSPAARPPSAKAFQRELEAWLSSEPDALQTADAAAPASAPPLQPNAATLIDRTPPVTLPLAQPAWRPSAPPITPRGATFPSAYPAASQGVTAAPATSPVLAVLLGVLTLPALVGIAFVVVVFVVAIQRIEARRSSESAPPPPTGPGAVAFDKRAAASALASVDVRSCQTADGPTGQGHVSITFAPDGRVADTVVDGGAYPGTAVGACIARKFGSVIVPAFAGAPVHVGKTFHLP